MERRLTRFDEYPRHQIGATFDTVADGSPHWSDGYYFTTGDDAGTVAWFMGFRLHANNDVLDAFTCVSVAGPGEGAGEGGGDGFGGRQLNRRWSRRLRPRIDDLDVGPVHVEIAEGLRTLRTWCASDDGQAFDLTWDGWCPPYNEDHVQVVVNGRLHSDRSNYTQCSTVTGWFEVDGERISVDGWTGVRDHSWGIGNDTGGPRSAAIAPPSNPAAPPGLRQWCVFRLPDRAVFWQFHAAGATAPLTKFESRCMFPYGEARPDFAYTAVEHDATFRTGANGRPIPRLQHATVRLTRPDGHVERYGIEPISYPVYLQGGGYFGGFADGLGRGVYRGDDLAEADTWDIDRGIGLRAPDHVTPNRWHYAEAWGRCTNLDDPADTGVGHLESVVIGAYAELPA